MNESVGQQTFRGVFSLQRLIEFWEQHLSAKGDHWARPYHAMRGELDRNPMLLGPIEDVSLLEPHMELVRALMSAVFPPAYWESEPMAALVPVSLEPVLVSPEFQRLLLEPDGSFRGRLSVPWEAFTRARLIRLNLLILREFYGVDKRLDHPIVRVVSDPETGLCRYFRFLPDLRFVRVHPLKPVRQLTDSERALILDHLTEPEVFQEIIRPEDFELRGFAVCHAVDVTQSEVLGEIERDVINREAIFTDAGFERLQQRLRALFGRPQLVAGLAAIKGDRTLLLNSGCKMTCNCIFSDSRHVHVSELKGSVFDRAAKLEKVVVVRDLRDEPSLTRVEEEILASGKRSLLVAPLFHQGRLVGTLDLSSPTPGDLGPMEELLARHLQPLFSMAIRRSLDELDIQIDSVIKQKCTAVHPSVEWRFRSAVLEHLEQALRGNQSELQPIVFKDVYPLYGATDIRGSSEGRNTAIQADLSDHLSLALDVVKASGEAKPLPLLDELLYRTGNLFERLQRGIGTGDEFTVIQFLRTELEPFFQTLRAFGPGPADAIRMYEAALDPQVGTVYRHRKNFEDSVSTFNRKISLYLEREQERAQAMFPHYFEKHQTDGMEYVIYVGSSMVQNGDFNQLYVRSLRLWQMLLACGIAWHVEQLKAVLKVPLDATHLILAHHTPLAVRFRFDEKRFDVDGAYDVGHEIVRSRIDKALVKGGNERLTQPGQLAVVYARPEESQEMVRHIHFLQSRGYLLPDHKALDLEDLPGVQGLKAIRVGVNLDSLELAERAGGAIG
jgi:hypothetical protein